ncbi:hypothetical protein ACIAD0171 [Acinetobacter baylyi ADP1]|uniref:Uncharacterized protein n=1 Tax=Acinetobacter baylyi (strain ATCC 33305 / BD413 / ADP1) TaxID=62977 RepID=Q6FFL4_ACIAD|nr:hypothetical protein ACIAD0171 [Acinetobacter baylyi ADP1]
MISLKMLLVQIKMTFYWKIKTSEFSLILVLKNVMTCWKYEILMDHKIYIKINKLGGFLGGISIMIYFKF